MMKLVCTCEELRHWYEQDQVGVAVIAAKLGVSAATAAKRLRRCGVTMRSGRFAAHPIDAELLRRLYTEEALPLRVIAAQLGVCIGTINNHRRRLGLPPRRSIKA